ncbi:MAG TPA: 50S ribosomal protein L25 [Anaerolineae bacterium]|nr:50S ribosomal protein L25 [Anaerolineae bacterium]
MDQIELNVAPREVTGKQVSVLRRAGLVPVVMYGRHDKPLVLQAKARELMKVLSKAGSSRLISIKVDGESDTHMALVREIQREPIRGDLLHTDFYAVSMTEEITVEVSIHFTGASPAAVRNEGVLTYGATTIEIECLPGDLIDSISVDLSSLAQVGDAIHVRDLTIPGTIKVLDDADDLVVRVTYLAAEEVEPVPGAAVTEAVVEPEVIKKGKIEEEEIEDGAAAKPGGAAKPAAAKAEAKPAGKAEAKPAAKK